MLEGRFPARAFQNITNQRGRIFLRQFFDRGEIACLARKKMLRRNHAKVVRRVLQLHWVRFFAREIDHDLIEKKIPLGDPAKSPAFVQTKCGRFKFIELFGCFRRQLSRFDKFLQFRIHASRTRYVEQFSWREKTLRCGMDFQSMFHRQDADATGLRLR